MAPSPPLLKAGAMAEEIHVTTELDAPPEQVWAVLADFERYHLWNSGVEQVVARTEWSTRLLIRLKRPGKRPVRLRGSLVEFNRPRLLQWSGGHPLWGLLSVTHTLYLRPAGGGTLLEQTAKVRGLLKRRGARAAHELMTETGAITGLHP
jgi:uncharacterized protein YndB with AHSA1/START domain